MRNTKINKLERMDIQQELNKRLTERGLYSNYYITKESINHLTGFIFLSKDRIKTYLVDMIAYQRNEDICDEQRDVDNILKFLDKSRERYRNKVERLSVLPRRVYTYSMILTFISLFMYIIHYKILNQWIWLEQSGINFNLFALFAIIGLLFMSLSFLLLPIKEISKMRYQNIVSVFNMLLKESTLPQEIEEKSNATYSSFLNIINQLYTEKLVLLDDVLLKLTKQTEIQDYFDIPISQKNVTRLIGLVIHEKKLIQPETVELQKISDCIVEKFKIGGKTIKKRSFNNALSDTLSTSKSDLEHEIHKNKELSQLLETDNFSFIQSILFEN